MMTNAQRVKYFNDEKVIGIDPGKNGGIAVYSITKRELIEVVKMPETAADLYNFFKLYSKNSFAYFEKVGSMPGQSGMFTFGKGWGNIEMALYALKIPNETVTPQKWQKIFQMGVRGNKTATEWKNKLKDRAQKLYPRVNLTLATADAILIMEYGRRIKTGEV